MGSSVSVAIAERIVPQPDRGEGDKIPIVTWIDEKLHEDKRDGYRYQEMSPQRDAWRLGLKGVNETAQALFEEKQFIEKTSLKPPAVRIFGREHLIRSEASYRREH